MNPMRIFNGEIKIQQNSNKIETGVEQAKKWQKISKTIRATEYNVEVKNLIKETLYNSAAQEIIKIIETPYYTLKIFLFICLKVSSGFCSYLIIELIMGYYSYGVLTAMRTLYETPVTFPKVTICNVNAFTTQYALEFLKKVNQENEDFIDIFDEVQMSYFDFSNKSDLVNSVFWQGIIKMNCLNETEKRKLSHSLEEILVTCYFN
jgi:hypothetical protein